MKKIYIEPTFEVVALKRQNLLSESRIDSGDDWGNGQETASRSFFGFGDDEE